MKKCPRGTVALRGWSWENANAVAVEDWVYSLPADGRRSVGFRSVFRGGAMTRGTLKGSDWSRIEHWTAADGPKVVSLIDRAEGSGFRGVLASRRGLKP